MSDIKEDENAVTPQKTKESKVEGNDEKPQINTVKPEDNVESGEKEKPQINTVNPEDSKEVKPEDKKVEKDALKAKIDKYGYNNMSLEDQKKWDELMRMSRKTVDRSNYSEDENARIQKALDANIIDSDAIAGTSYEEALHKILLPDDIELLPENVENFSIDVDAMAAALTDDTSLSAAERLQYRRALTVVGNIQDRGFKIVRNKQTGRYWLENASGGRKFVANGIVEVADLLDKFGSAKTVPVKDPKPNDGSKQIQETPEKAREEETVIDEGEIQEMGLSSQDKWRMAALATDLISTLAALGVKTTGYVAGAASVGTGAVIGQGAGAAISIGGGIMATLMDGWADFTDDNVSAWEMTKNIGTRLGMEAMEGLTYAPVSLIVKFGKGAKYGKIVRKAIGVAMTTGAINQALATDWNEILDKDVTDWSIDDMRQVASMVQFTLGGVAAGVGRAQARKGLNAAGAKVAKTKIKGSTELEEGIRGSKKTGDIAKNNKLVTDDINARVKKGSKKINEGIDADTKKVTDANIVAGRKKKADVDAAIDESKGIGSKHKESIAKIEKVRQERLKNKDKGSDAINKKHDDAISEMQTKEKNRYLALDKKRQDKLLTNKAKGGKNAKKGLFASVDVDEAGVRQRKRRVAKQKKEINKARQAELDANAKKATDKANKVASAGKKKLAAKTKKKLDDTKYNASTAGKKANKDAIDAKTKKANDLATKEGEKAKKEAKKKLTAKVKKRSENKYGKIDKKGAAKERNKQVSNKVAEHENKVAGAKREKEIIANEVGMQYGKVNKKGLVARAKDRGKNILKNESKVRRNKRIAAENTSLKNAHSKLEKVTNNRNKIHKERTSVLDSQIKSIESKFKGKTMPKSVRRDLNKLKIEKQDLTNRIKQNSYELDASKRRMEKRIAENSGVKPEKVKQVSEVEGYKARQKEIDAELASLKGKDGAKAQRKKLKQERKDLNESIRKANSTGAKLKAKAKAAGELTGKGIGAITKGTMKTISAPFKLVNGVRKRVINPHSIPAMSKGLKRSDLTANILPGSNEADKASKAREKIDRAGFAVDPKTSNEDALRIYQYLVEKGEIKGEGRKTSGKSDDATSNKKKLIVKRKAGKKRSGGTMEYKKAKLIPKAENGFRTGQQKVQDLLAAGKVDEARAKLEELSVKGLISNRKYLETLDLVNISIAERDARVAKEKELSRIDPNIAGRESIGKEIQGLVDAGKYDDAIAIINGSDLFDERGKKELIGRVETYRGKEVFDNTNAAVKYDENGNPIKKEEVVESIIPKSKPDDKYKPGWGDAFAYLKPSDLLSTIRGPKHKEFSYSSYRDKVSLDKAPLVKNMRGYAEDMNRMKLLPKVGGGGYEAAMAGIRNFNTSLAAQNKKSTENAAYIDALENKQLAVENANNAKLIARDNKEGTEAEALRREKMLKEEKTWKEDQAAKDRLEGQMLNDSMRTIQNIYNKKITHRGNNLMYKKNVWDTKYKPGYDEAIAKGDKNAATRMENEFYKEYEIDPFSIDTELTKIKERVSTAPDNPYNQY